MAIHQPPNTESSESLAIQALAFLASDPERLGRFLALSGIGPERIRTAASEPGFLAGVLDHIASDEQLVLAFADAVGVKPGAVERARTTLAGQNWEREVP